MAVPRYQFKMYDPFLSFSNPDNSLFVKVADGLPMSPGNTDNDALFRMASDAYKRIAPMKSKGDFDKELSNYHDELDVLRMRQEEMVAMGLLETGLSDGTKIEVNFETAADDLILAMAWRVYRENRDLNSSPSHEMEQRFLKWLSFLALINIDRVLHSNACRVEGAIEATIHAAFAVSHMLAIESSNQILQEARQNFAFEGRLARH
jgi:hypothetical protein